LLFASELLVILPEYCIALKSKSKIAPILFAAKFDGAHGVTRPTETVPLLPDAFSCRAAFFH
jgi:hypothetical protein